MPIAYRVSILTLFVIFAANTALVAQNRRVEMLKIVKASDKNNDGKVTKDELPTTAQRFFSRMDTNGDRAIDKKEIAALEKRFAGGKSDPAVKRREGDLRGKQGPGIAVGKPALDFTLKTIDGKSEVKLSSFQGKKPVALIFGSYT